MKLAAFSVLAVVAGFAVATASIFGIRFIVERFTDIGTIQWHSSPPYTWGGLTTNLLGLAISVATGGFVAARIANRSSVWHAVAVGICCMATHELPREIYPIWFSVLSSIAVLPASVLGGWVAALTNKAVM